ncbi:MAG: hypothetical protein OEN52_09090 [Gammaproteobacteria bacterium]|nr:hypothetical protein [Gammaproteobacteria bacterium]MDH3561090.1 hypothetical protein [Gammaproteobacteria bacterium]
MGYASYTPPQAQRIQIARQMDLEKKKSLAKKLAGIADGNNADDD